MIYATSSRIRYSLSARQMKILPYAWYTRINIRTRQLLVNMLPRIRGVDLNTRISYCTEI